MHRTLILSRAARSAENAAKSKPHLKVAIVGGGASGLSAALHLAPLVSKLIRGPIDLFEASKNSTDASTSDCDKVGDYSRGSGAFGRDIGVGIWSTALLPFDPKRKSHNALLERLEGNGLWVGGVGYRTPDGDWLTRGNLAGSPFRTENANDPSANNIDPALIFLQEKELLGALRESVALEGESFVHTHYGRGVEAIMMDDFDSFDGDGDHRGGRLCFSDGTESKRKYHLILAAGGMFSKLRARYSRHLDHTYSPKFFLRNGPAPPSVVVQRSEPEPSPGDGEEDDSVIFDFEERGYLVFRGNSSVNIDDSSDGCAFQTWGKGKSMRFATVPVPLLKKSASPSADSGQVWFVTLDDPNVTSCQSPSERKELLLKAFRSWHDPVCRLIESTPAEDILMETAVAHRHSAAALGSGFVRRCIDAMNCLKSDEPMVCFVGDADMAVDPVLAQGFTIGMEDGANVAYCVERAFQQFERVEGQQMHPLDALRLELERRHEEKDRRLLCLLRATELVQTLAQPRSNTVMGALALAVRPIMQYATPNFVKATVFDWMMRYSLGVTGGKQIAQKIKKS